VVTETQCVLYEHSMLGEGALFYIGNMELPSISLF
jgi:hypothetical protein